MKVLFYYFTGHVFYLSNEPKLVSSMLEIGILLAPLKPKEVRSFESAIHGNQAQEER